MKTSYAALSLAAALACGCAPGVQMSEAQCQSANWYELGRGDALQGRQPQLESYRTGCPAVSESDYLAGWRIGYSEWDQRVSSRAR